MTNSAKPHIFFTDDEPKILKVVARTLEPLRCQVTCFIDCADCLEQLRSQTCDLLITDVKMPEMDGIELLTEAKRIIPSLPVLVITGYGDVPMAVRAMKAGATDFIEKPLERLSFMSAVESLLKRTNPADLLVDKVLTGAEMRVLRLILDGKGNKETARILHRSVRTIEDHRRHIMHKLDVDNLIDLLKRVAAMGLFEIPEER